MGKTMQQTKLSSSGSVNVWPARARAAVAARPHPHPRRSALLRVTALMGVLASACTGPMGEATGHAGAPGSDGSTTRLAGGDPSSYVATPLVALDGPLLDAALIDGLRWREPRLLLGIYRGQDWSLLPAGCEGALGSEAGYAIIDTAPELLLALADEATGDDPRLCVDSAASIVEELYEAGASLRAERLAEEHAWLVQGVRPTSGTVDQPPEGDPSPQPNDPASQPGAVQERWGDLTSMRHGTAADPSPQPNRPPAGDPSPQPNRPGNPPPDRNGDKASATDGGSTKDTGTSGAQASGGIPPAPTPAAAPLRPPPDRR